MITPSSPAIVREAAQRLRAGQLAVFPTETVYGLGGDATNNQAVARIFEVKARPRHNPLIIHLPSVEAAACCAVLSALAQKAAAAFWPGPLTLVLPRRGDCAVSPLATADLPTVAVRVPAHPVAQRLLLAAGCPVAAPSANRSGRASSSRACHVKTTLGQKIGMIIDGGPCDVGLESTVLDMSGEQPCILRPGGIPREDLAAVLGPITASTADGSSPNSPGQLTAHYSPGVPVRLNATAARTGEALLGFGPMVATLNLSPSGNLEEAAANLFTALHQLSAEGWRGIAAVPIPNHGLGLAINDRLLRASRSTDQPPQVSV